jgi:hypothetical protein
MQHIQSLLLFNDRKYMTRRIQLLTVLHGLSFAQIMLDIS